MLLFKYFIYKNGMETISIVVLIAVFWNAHTDEPLRLPTLVLATFSLRVILASALACLQFSTTEGCNYRTKFGLLEIKLLRVPDCHAMKKFRQEGKLPLIPGLHVSWGRMLKVLFKSIHLVRWALVIRRTGAAVKDINPNPAAGILTSCFLFQSFLRIDFSSSFGLDH
jgi:hypothetical protein